ncbi:MAG: TonB-dependent receptor [Salinivirgaceae bacterium]|nr:TonB-dependent receptor [Salinivirgaceae bacterium]
MQVLQNSTLSYSSLETWFPANANIKPVLVDVVSAGWFQNIGSQYSLSAELYYKWYTNQIDYVDHARLLNNPYIEGEVRTGTARAYGLELNARKTQGRLTGGISYTYSRSLRTIDDINDGREYSSLYDIPHDLKINANYKLTANWSASAVWIYTSGRPTTLPVGFYQTEDSYTEMAVPIYSERNSSRFPAYHRLDLSVGYEPEKQGRVVWSANFGLYNVYGRKNPLGYRFDTDHGQVRVMQTTLFRLLPNFAVKARF